MKASGTYLLQYLLLTTWRQQGVELELGLLPAAEAAVWLLSSPSPRSADGVSNTLPPPASSSENQNWKTPVISRCSMLPTTPRSSHNSPYFSDGETDELDQRREDLHKDNQMCQSQLLIPLP